MAAFSICGLTLLVTHSLLCSFYLSLYGPISSLELSLIRCRLGYLYSTSTYHIFILITRICLKMFNCYYYYYYYYLYYYYYYILILL